MLSKCLQSRLNDLVNAILKRNVSILLNIRESSPKKSVGVVNHGEMDKHELSAFTFEVLIWNFVLDGPCHDL